MSAVLATVPAGDRRTLESLAGIGGAGALLAKHITAAEVIAYPDLGTEAIRRLTLGDFPAIVANDCHGGDVYVEAREAYRRPEGATP